MPGGGNQNLVELANLIAADLKATQTFVQTSDRITGTDCGVGKRGLDINICGDDVGIGGGFAGVGFWVEAQSTGSPGVEITVLSTTVAVGKTLNLHQVQLTSRAEGKWRLIAGGSTIASGFTGASLANDPFRWIRERPISAGTLIELKFTARTGSPTADADGYLQASEV